MKIEAVKCDVCAGIIKNGYAINGKVTLLSINDNQDISEYDTILKEKECHLCKPCMRNVLEIDLPTLKR